MIICPKCGYDSLEDTMSYASKLIPIIRKRWHVPVELKYFTGEGDAEVFIRVPEKLYHKHYFHVWANKQQDALFMKHCGGSLFFSVLNKDFEDENMV